jgi:16S rRNA (cytosine1402-N4)-methyltransferase
MPGDKNEHGELPDKSGKAQVYHIPVMESEVLSGLAIQPDGLYIDCTFGGGGHSAGILKKLGKKGKLIAFDQDPDARQNLPIDERIVFVPQNFRHLQRFLRLHGVTEVDGILADLGVSTHQFEQPTRGFSFRFDGPLDMRMDKQQPLTAAGIVNRYDEQKLHKIFEQYGEVTNAKTLARKIVEERTKQNLTTVQGFTSALRGAVKGNPNKYFAQVFQSLRIEVNDELGALKEMLKQSITVVKPGGRIAVITFHSLEDRIVKFFFKTGDTKETEADENPYGQQKEPPFHALTKKPIVPAEIEIKQNPKSRSAKLRVAERM